MTTFIPEKSKTPSQKKIYWSIKPGEFLERNSGEQLIDAPLFTGTIGEWYSTIAILLKEICCDGKQNLIVSPDMQTVLSHTPFYMPSFAIPFLGQNIDNFTNTGCTFDGKLKLSEGDVNLFVNPFWNRNIISATESCDKLDERHDLVVKGMIY